MRMRSVLVVGLIGLGFTPGAIAPSFAQVSAQGSPTIACVARRLSKGAIVAMDLVVMDSNGAHQTVAASVPAYTFLQMAYPAWSPDLDPANGYQGYVVYSDLLSWTLWKVSVSVPGDGTFTCGSPQAVPLTAPNYPQNTYFKAVSASWSPDGQWLAVYGRTGYGSTDVQGGIWIVPPSGGTPTLAAAGGYPCWEPAAARVACSSFADLVVQPVFSGTPATLVTNAFPGTSSSTSTWGARGVAFKGTTTTRSGKTQSALYVVDPNSSALPVSLSQLQAVPGTGDAISPSWSPGGQYLIAATGTGIVQIDPATGAQTVLASSSSRSSLSSPTCRPVLP